MGSYTILARRLQDGLLYYTGPKQGRIQESEKGGFVKSAREARRKFWAYHAPVLQNHAHFN
jgi:hypothetical protein